MNANELQQRRRNSEPLLASDSLRKAPQKLELEVQSSLFVFRIFKRELPLSEWDYANHLQWLMIPRLTRADARARARPLSHADLYRGRRIAGSDEIDDRLLAPPFELGG